MEMVSPVMSSVCIFVETSPTDESWYWTKGHLVVKPSHRVKGFTSMVSWTLSHSPPVHCYSVVFSHCCMYIGDTITIVSTSR